MLPTKLNVAWALLVLSGSEQRLTCKACADWLHILQAMMAVLKVRVSGGQP